MHLLFYNIFLWAYYNGIFIASKWNPKARRWRKGRKNLLTDIRSKEISRNGKVIWMHCASLGEFEQGRPVLEKLKEQFPSYKIVITFFSPSGYEVQQKYAGADFVFYLPPDSRRNANAFIEAIQPAFVIWVKYDFWFYYLHELKKREIPVILISAMFRKSQPFFSWYGKLHRYMLDCFMAIFVQTEGSKMLVSSLRLRPTVIVGGDTRFDRVIEMAQDAMPVPVAASFCKTAPVIVAGSTWPEDEEELDHYANIHPEVRFIIAPHEIDEDHLQYIERLFKHSVRYSQLERLIQAVNTFEEKVTVSNVLIVDNIGLLGKLYRYATIAYVGGGFGDDGVHNVLEAAVYGKPVIYGPVIDKYVEAMELVECGGGVIIDSALEAEATFNRLLTNVDEYAQRAKAASTYVQQKKGATEKIIKFVQENRLLTNE